MPKQHCCSCSTPASHHLDNRPYCCHHFDELVEHGANLQCIPAAMPRLRVLSDAILRDLKARRQILDGRRAALTIRRARAIE